MNNKTRVRDYVLMEKLEKAIAEKYKMSSHPSAGITSAWINGTKEHYMAIVTHAKGKKKVEFSAKGADKHQVLVELVASFLGNELPPSAMDELKVIRGEDK